MQNPALRRAAVLLASLPDRQAAALLSALSPEEASAVSNVMAGLGKVEDAEYAAVAEDFLNALDRRDPGKTPELAKDVASDESAEAPFRFLDGLAASEIADLVRVEHPQTIAVIITQLPAARAAEVLALLPADLQASVVERMAAMSAPPAPEILRDVATAMMRRSTAPETIPLARGMKTLVKMFGAMRPATERKLLEVLAENDPDRYQEIRRAMFGPIVAAAG